MYTSHTNQYNSCRLPPVLSARQIYYFDLSRSHLFNSHESLSFLDSLFGLGYPFNHRAQIPNSGECRHGRPMNNDIAIVRLLYPVNQTAYGHVTRPFYVDSMQLLRANWNTRVRQTAGTLPKICTEDDRDPNESHNREKIYK